MTGLLAAVVAALDPSDGRPVFVQAELTSDGGERRRLFPGLSFPLHGNLLAVDQGQRSQFGCEQASQAAEFRPAGYRGVSVITRDVCQRTLCGSVSGRKLRSTGSETARSDTRHCVIIGSGGRS